MPLPSMKNQPTFPAKALSAEERDVLTARIGALIDEKNQLQRELASARAERDALQRALNALERNQKREPATRMHL
jgi:FtsZ-binding cell division protein ZapB